jgi:ribosomal RNA-processing protein 12
LGKRKRPESDAQDDLSEADEKNDRTTSSASVKRQKRVLSSTRASTAAAAVGGGGGGAVRHTGEEYRSTKAAGDMKKPGRPDPYAYLPLNPRMLNKRRRLHAYKQFENVITAAKKGAKTKPNKKLRKRKSLKQ